MRQIDFNELPRATRERFVRSLVSDSPSAAPICRRLSKPQSGVAWYLAFVAGVLALGGLGWWHFGSLAAPVQDRRFLVGYMGAMALIGLACAMLARRRAIRGSLPFVPGVYVFPLDVVDARTRELELYSMSELQSIEPVHHQRGGRYTHSTLWFVFPTRSFVIEVQGRARAEAELAAVQQSRLLLGAASQRGPELATYDPFAEARERNFEPAHDHGLLARDRPLWTRFIWAISIIVGLMGGVGAWRLRNWQSDERAFKKLRASPEVSLTETYVRGGGLHAAEARGSILPRARLAEARRETGPKRAEALARFLETYPKTSVEAEARAELAELLHGAYVAQTTVSGLNAFIDRWPDAADVPAARAKIKELHAKTLADFRQHASSADEAVVPVIEGLLAWADGHGPIDVRLRKRAVSSLMDADKLLAKGLLDDEGPATGGNAEVSRLLGDAGRQDAVIVAGLRHAFRTVFPADVIALRRAPAGSEITVPTITVDYELRWSGATYLARDAKRRFLGLALKVDASVQLPGEPRVLTFAFAVECPETVPVEPHGLEPFVQAIVPSDAPAALEDARMYGAMFVRAFDQLGWKLSNVLLDPAAAAREPR